MKFIKTRITESIINRLDEAEDYSTKIKTKDLEDLPGFPEDIHWYTNRYGIQFKEKESGAYYIVTGDKEDIDRFIKDFEIGIKLTEANENKRTYRVTYSLKNTDNVFNAIMVKANSEQEAKDICLNKIKEVNEILGVQELNDLDIENNKKKGMSLLEDFEEGEDIPEPPVVGDDFAASSVINDLIKDEWTAIDQYNTAMANFKEWGIDGKVIEVLNHIMLDENTHVGNLQEILALFAPATDKIEKGNEQAEDILNK